MLADMTNFLPRLIALTWLIVAPLPLAAQLPDLTTLSLEELMQVEVVLVSRREQTLLEAPAAVFLVTGEDIRRSGATSVPEALRLVPGLQVARIDANKWAISVRGFNGQFANKLLVLIDGRSVYTPLFSGVYWDVQDVLLEDVERIEVIRGPGAALWGANAVNGIINIITKDAANSQGLLVQAGGGIAERSETSLRYGSSLGERSAYRVYGKYFEQDATVDSSGATTADAWNVLRSGFRLDWQAGEKSTFTLQGDAYRGEVGQIFERAPVSLIPPYRRSFVNDADISGGNLLANGRRVISKNSDVILQLYYDRTRRWDSYTGGEVRNTFDADLQHRLRLGLQQEFIWGLGYRLAHSKLRPAVFFSADTPRRTDQLFSLFVQDEITLHPERWHLAVGAKLEHNAYTGPEFQPNARLRWTPRPRHTLWTSVSRAVRTPSRGENDLDIFAGVEPPDGIATGAPVTSIPLSGDGNLKSEKLIAFEAGYRAHIGDRFLVDVASFYNKYSDLVSLVFGPPSFRPEATPPHGVLPVLFTNQREGETFGAELVLDWQAGKRWRLRTAYSYLNVDVHDPTQSLAFSVEGDSPHHQWVQRAAVDLAQYWKLDMVGRYNAEVTSHAVDAYFAFDTRLGWQPVPGLDLALVGRNLLDGRHREFGSDFGNSLATQVERSFYFTLSWRFNRGGVGQ